MTPASKKLPLADSVCRVFATRLRANPSSRPAGSIRCKCPGYSSAPERTFRIRVIKSIGRFIEGKPRRIFLALFRPSPRNWPAGALRTGVPGQFRWTTFHGRSYFTGNTRPSLISDSRRRRRVSRVYFVVRRRYPSTSPINPLKSRPEGSFVRFRIPAAIEYFLRTVSGAGSSAFSR